MLFQNYHEEGWQGRQMKICHLADAGNVITQKWVNYFARKGHESHLISNRLSSGKPGEGYSEGVQLYRLTTPIPPHWAKSGYINIPLQFIQIRRLINKIKPDVVHVHSLTINAYLAFTSGFHPVVFTAWGSEILIEPKKSRLYKFLTQYALKRAELITCDGENLKEEMIKLGADPQKISLIYHGIDTQKFSPQRGNEVRDRLGLNGLPVVISTRKLAPIYDVETLIRAIPLVLEHIPQASFIIAGDGEQKEYLESLAISLGVSENVRFIGWIPQDELPNYLASSDIYVSTSLSDSISISLLEAMACELPAVVTNSGDNEKWIDDGVNGFIVPIKSPEILASRIVELLEDEDIRRKFAQANRQAVEQRANYEKEMDKMEKLYRKLIRRQR